MRAGQLTFQRFWNYNRVTRNQARSTAKAGPKDVSKTPSTPVTQKVAAKSATKSPKATPAKKVAPVPAHTPKRARKASSSSEEDPSEDEIEVEGEEEVDDGEDIEESDGEEDEDEEEPEPNEQDAKFISNTDDEEEKDDEGEYESQEGESGDDGDSNSSSDDASEISEVVEVTKKQLPAIAKPPKQAKAIEPRGSKTNPTSKNAATPKLFTDDAAAEVKAVKAALAKGGEDTLVQSASPRDVTHQLNAAARHVQMRLAGVRVCLYVGCSQGGVILHYWYCVEPKYECIGVTNGDGRTYKRGLYYVVDVQNQVVASFTETEPVHFEVPDLPISAFDIKLEPTKYLAAIGVLQSVDVARKVTLKTGDQAFVREITVLVNGHDGMAPMAVSLWGERLGTAKLVVGSVVVILNCKSDKFQDMARLSVGDTGTILHNVRTHQAEKIRKQSKAKAQLVLPAGLEKMGSSKRKSG